MKVHVLNFREKPRKSQAASNTRIRAKFSGLAQDAEFADPIRKISEALALKR
jgi:hypothetical protein